VVSQKGSVRRKRRPRPDGAGSAVVGSEGEAFYNGERLAGAEAMRRSGIPIPGLQARDGLATINGSNVSHGHVGAASLRDGTLAAAGRDCGGDVHLKRCSGNLKTVQRKTPRAAGFQRSNYIGAEYHEGGSRLGSVNSESENQGAGCPTRCVRTPQVNRRRS